MNKQRKMIMLCLCNIVFNYFFWEVNSICFSICLNLRRVFWLKFDWALEWDQSSGALSFCILGIIIITPSRNCCHFSFCILSVIIITLILRKSISVSAYLDADSCVCLYSILWWWNQSITRDQHKVYSSQRTIWDERPTQHPLSLAYSFSRHQDDLPKLVPTWQDSHQSSQVFNWVLKDIHKRGLLPNHALWRMLNSFPSAM